MLMRVLTDLFSRYEDERQAAAFTRRFLDHLKPPGGELEVQPAAAAIASPFRAAPAPAPAWSSSPSSPTWVDAEIAPAASMRSAPACETATLRAPAPLAAPQPETALEAVASRPHRVELGSSVPSESDSEFELPTTSPRLHNSSWALRNDSGSDFLIIISGRDSRGLLRVSRDFAAIPEINLHAMTALQS